MKKIKLWPAPHLEVRVCVSDEMEADLRECRESAKRIKNCKDCNQCSWLGVEIENTCLCEWLAVVEKVLEEKVDEKTD